MSSPEHHVERGRDPQLAIGESDHAPAAPRARAQGLLEIKAIDHRPTGSVQRTDADQLAVPAAVPKGMASPETAQPSAPGRQRDHLRAAPPTAHHPIPPTIAGTQLPSDQNWLQALVPPQANGHLGAPTKPPGVAPDGCHSVAIDRGRG